MGRGDRKTKKGKIAIRSYGNKRPATAAKVAGAAKGTAVKKTAAARPTAAPAKKAAAPAKKAAAPAKKS
jgi:30S ribosomal protein S31